MDLDLDLVASPPSPTLDALRITSRVAVRALLNPAPGPSQSAAPRPPSAPVMESLDEELSQFDPPKDVEAEGAAAIAEFQAEVAVEKVDVDIVTDGEVTPLTLPEPEVVMGMQGADEEIAAEVAADVVRVELLSEGQVEARLAHQVRHAIDIPWSFSRPHDFARVLLLPLRRARVGYSNRSLIVNLLRRLCARRYLSRCYP